MPATNNSDHYPIAGVVGFLCGFLQEIIFSNPDIAPTVWRYEKSSTGRTSKIRISAPFVIDNAKALSQPYVIVERGEFSFNNRVINDSRTAEANTTDEEERVLLPTGVVLMTCGSRSAQEASSLANFITLVINAGKNSIYTGSQFIRLIRTLTIGPEVPVWKGHEVQRYETTIAFEVGLHFAFRLTTIEAEKMNKFSVEGVRLPYELNGTKGEFTQGSGVFTDTTVKFGEDVLFEPGALSEKMYQVGFPGGNPRVYIDSINYEPGESYGYSLNLVTVDETGKVFTPYAAPADAENLEYVIKWNEFKLFFNYPGTYDT